nr:winged helix-turn-helix domain-containing protein [Ignavibacteria bacterium]
TEYKKTNKESFEVEISHYDMASLLGTIPETLSRTLQKLQDENLIEVAGKSFTINNVEKLKKIAE